MYRALALTAHPSTLRPSLPPAAGDSNKEVICWSAKRSTVWKQRGVCRGWGESRPRCPSPWWPLRLGEEYESQRPAPAQGRACTLNGLLTGQARELGSRAFIVSPGCQANRATLLCVSSWWGGPLDLAVGLTYSRAVFLSTGGLLLRALSWPCAPAVSSVPSGLSWLLGVAVCTDQKEELHTSLHPLWDTLSPKTDPTVGTGGTKQRPVMGDWPASLFQEPC